MNIFTCLLLLLGFQVDAPPDKASRPNVVIIFVDDMGWGDIPSQGATGWSMPNIERLEEEGTRFTRFHVAQPVCSASRAALLTGCYPNRIGIHGALPPSAKYGIHEDETTMAELFKSKGYATGMFGKWHLGHHRQFLPIHHGFDEYLGIPYSNDMWPGHPVTPKNWPKLPLIEGDQTIEIIEDYEDQDAITRRLTERSVDFINRHSDAPFFLYLAHPQPHVPLGADARFKGSSEQGFYGDVMQELDWSLGQVLQALDEKGIADETLVVFTSDNGPWINYGDHAGTTGHLREAKGTTFGGGVRVPCVARWPGHVRENHVNDINWMTIDLFPTVAGIIDAELPEHTIDGRDAISVLRSEQGATSPQDVYLFYYGRNNLEAIQWGRWRLHLPHTYRSMEGRPGGTGGKPTAYTYGIEQPMALYDILIDPGETTDVKEAHSEVVTRMLELVESARADLGDSLTERQGAGVREPGRLPDEEEAAG
ncbi:MAG: arylsulfatase [Phycisphaerae bacterium]|nr:arylsulfatase [Phycisphaerae bacterium]